MRRGAELALQDKRFEDALELLLRVAQILGESQASARGTVQSAMLEEVRRLFSATTLENSQPVQELIARALLVQSPCREATFWQALCFLRSGELDRASTALQAAHSGVARSLLMDDGLATKEQPNDLSNVSDNGPPASPHGAAFIDPPLYLGAMLLREGRAKDSLRYLTEANRVDGNCPIVTLQLGAAMIAAEGDTQLAVRALRRALGSRGLALWAGEPRRAWIEGFPEGRSYVRKLASAYPFVCPIWGADLSILIQQGHLALAQGLYKMEVYQEAADLFAQVLQHGAPSLLVLRGLGLSLARLGKYDDAFKYLRIAHEMEEPKDRVTAGFLALCGAKGNPTQPEDKARNIQWAINVVTRFNAPGDRDWAHLISELFAEARDAKVALGMDEQLFLCEHLWSVHATDPQAALAYYHLQATYPQAVHREYAWLYCRAAQQHNVGNTLELFERTFADPEPARAFFAQEQWDWDAVELTYLERAASLAPGQFPSALGAQYSVRGEAILLDCSQKQEKAGNCDAALRAAETLYKLAPSSPLACDRLAFLHHRRGNADQAARLLESWHDQHPYDPRPLVRSAVLLHRRGLASEGQAKLREAMKLCEGPRRARIAFLAARLTLQSVFTAPATEVSGADSPSSEGLLVAEGFLEQCLRDDPHHGDALWCLAAVSWLRGDRAKLAQQALSKAEAPDARSQFFASLCRLAAQDFGGLLTISVRSQVVNSPESPVPAPRKGDVIEPRLSWADEYAYLAGLAHFRLDRLSEAAQTMTGPALNRDSPSAAHAQALLGMIGFKANDLDEAAKWWQTLDAKKRAAWKLSDALAQCVLVTALEAYAHSRFEEAVEKLRAAGKLGCRDRRLGSLLVTALFKAGQALIYPRTADIQ
jgi:tetratricopeptide (TPR) repeat protein